MIESPLIAAYMDALVRAKAPGSTFAGEARRLLHELSDPDVRIGELLERIDRAPADPFEKYLRREARSPR